MHQELNTSDLNKIIALKMQHWSYPEHEQKGWIDHNLLPNDHHLLMKDEKGSLLAYLNLVNVIINTESYCNEFVGIGNVCVDRTLQGKGYGLILMQYCMFMINKNDLSGLLLCKTHLASFYQKAGWKLYNGSVKLMDTDFNEAVLFSKLLTANQIFINKSF